MHNDFKRARCPEQLYRLSTTVDWPDVNFPVGTRLTRVSRALRMRNQGAALDMAGAAVSDWDGGTQLGDALGAFLKVPRYAGFARSAVVVIVSDGLERGEPDALIAAVQRLSRLAYRILWLTPLAADASYEPRTAAMAAIAPILTRIGRGGSVAAIADEILGFARKHDDHRRAPPHLATR